MKFDVRMRNNDKKYELVLTNDCGEVVKGLGYTSVNLVDIHKLLDYIYNDNKSDLLDVLIDDMDYIKDFYEEV